MRRLILSFTTACLLACGLALDPGTRAHAAEPGDAAVALGDPVPGIPFIDRAFALAGRDGYQLVLRGHFPSDSCWTIGALDSARFALVMFPRDSCRDTSLVGWGWSFPLGRLMPGYHRVELTLAVIESEFVVPTIYRGVFEFEVPRDTLPGLPYVEVIDISSTRNGPPCPTDSIRVSLSGYFPNPCYSVKRIDLVHVLGIPGIPDGPPFVHVIVDRGNCLIFCPEVLQPWSASIVMPPRPAGSYQQAISMVEVDCARQDSMVALHSTTRPFDVLPECPNSELCLRGDFVRRRAECDAVVGPGNPGELTFSVTSAVALAGLQGGFTLEPALLRITGMRAVGAAAGMRLDWVPTTTGARFTLFAESGAPIRGCDPDSAIFCVPEPVIELQISAHGSPLPRVTTVMWNELLGSTIDGAGVPECPILPYERIAFRGARVCTETECDFNADGRADIRDLVLMVHCVNRTGACPPGGAFDCNGDSASSLADVICCARHILRRNPNCPECPPDTLRPAPRVRATLGTPVHSETAAELPLSIVGAEHFGGALFELSFPADRYDAAAGLVGEGSTSGWLELHETRDGKLAIGLVRLGPVVTLDVDQRLEITVRLTLKPGQTPGGEVSMAASEFSGSDGAMLAVNLGTLAQPLTGPTRVALSSARPNPSGGETSFSLTLDRPGRVEVGVYDLSGRRVARVFEGTLTVGEHVMRWDGRDDDGIPAANGVYFYRAAAGGPVASRKLVLLRQR